MKKISFSVKLVVPTIVLVIALAISSWFAFKNLDLVVEEYKVVSNELVPKTKGVGEFYSDFKTIRIGLRSLGLPGIDSESQKNAINDVVRSIENFEKIQSYLTSQYPLNNEEKELWSKVNSAWINFKNVGGRVLDLQKDRSPQNLEIMTQIFLKDCPNAADQFNTAIVTLNN